MGGNTYLACAGVELKNIPWEPLGKKRKFLGDKMRIAKRDY